MGECCVREFFAQMLREYEWREARVRKYNREQKEKKKKSQMYNNYLDTYLRQAVCRCIVSGLKFLRGTRICSEFERRPPLPPRCVMTVLCFSFNCNY